MIIMNPTTLPCLLACLLLAAPWPVPAADSKIFKTTDEAGNTVFTDRPQEEDAQEVEVKEPMTFPADEYAREYRKFEPATNEETGDAGPPYTLEITSPAPDEAIRSNAGDMKVTFRILPGLKAGHRLDLVMDGAVEQQILAPGPISLENVDRGTHQLQLQVTDLKRNEVLQSSEPVSFTILRHSVMHAAPK